MARRPDSNGGDTDEPTTSDETETGEEETLTESNDVSSESNEGLTGENGGLAGPGGERSALVDRRDCMKLLGGTAAAVVGLGATATAGAAESYDLIEVGENESYTASLGSGDTLENVLIDVRADNADVHISADGDGWEIRNVAVRGRIDIGDDSPGGDDASYEGGYSSVFSVDASAGGRGLIENVYLGDGIAPGVDKTGLITATNHEGHIDVRNFNCGGFSTTCFYISGFGREGTGGSMTIENSYFENSSSAHLRPAGNVTIRNCVITNTNEVVYLPRTFGGVEQAVTSRGIWTSYSGSTTLVENCDIDIRESNTCEAPWDYSGPCQANAVWASEAGIDLVDCEVRGSVGGNVNESGTGSNPDLSLPSGCPSGPKVAANGTAGSDGSGDSGSGGSGNPNSGSDGSVITITGGSPSSVVTYAFEVSESVELGASANSEDTASGTTATGKLAGGSDSFRFTQEVTDFGADGEVTVSIDGQTVDPNELASDGDYRNDESDDESGEDENDEEPTLSRSIRLSGGTRDEPVDYTFAVSEAVAKGERANPEESVDETNASGHVIGGTDSFDFAGEITSFDATGDLSITVDGETVDQAALGDDAEDGSGNEESLPNGVSISGGSIDSPVEYAFSVSDALAEGPNANSEDSVSGTSAEGVVAGGTDDYEFAGEIASFSATGNPTVTVNGSEVDQAELGDESDGSSGDEESPELDRTLTVSGGSPSNTVDYAFSVSGAVAKGERANPEESVDGTNASGHVIGGTDSFAFAGEVTSFDASGTVSLTIDGQTADPDEFDSGSDGSGDDGSDDSGEDDTPDLSRSLTVSGGSLSNTVDYSFAVSEAVAKGEQANSEESISGTTASGHVAGGTDSFAFAGDVTSFEASGDVSLTIDGESVDPASYGDGSEQDDGSEPELTNTVRISGGSLSNQVSYSFTVSEAVSKGERANSEESISGTTASGHVVGGTDSFVFAGDITNFESSGDLTVTVNGSQADL